jgi:hypothetical protein
MNASRLQQEVSRRLQRVQEVVDDGVRIGVPRPQFQSPDASGCNWTMKHFGNAAGFEAVIAGVLKRVRADYNLAEDVDVQEAAVPPRSGADPFGGESKRAERANPFGETQPRECANPFGEAGSATAGDPFASPAKPDDDAVAPQKTPPRDPFAAD